MILYRKIEIKNMNDLQGKALWSKFKAKCNEESAKQGRKVTAQQVLGDLMRGFTNQRG